MSWKPRSSVVPSGAQTVTGNSSAVQILDPAGQLSVYVDVTAVSGGTPTLDLKVQWSHDGSTFFDAQPADSFTQITATGRVCKIFTVKGPWYRVAWTIGGSTPSFTFAAHEYTSSL